MESAANHPDYGAMVEDASERVRESVDAVYRLESRRILATLIRLLGDFDLAEDAMHDAFRAALEQWGHDGVPDNPRAWLISTGRFKAIDGLRRRSRFDDSKGSLDTLPHADAGDGAVPEDESIEDDRLRLIFTCCHPALAEDARVALTLREVCGLTTEEIARAFLTVPSTLAQRIVRAKAKIRDARIPYQVPSPAELPDRLEGVLQVIYLVFNEGYSASSGASLTRPDLSGEAIRLGRLLMELLPEPEAMGLLALMLLQESRRVARSSPSGDLVLLEDQDRSLWNGEQIWEGKALAERARSSRRPGPYALQAAIAAVHADAPDAAATDWARIAGLYDLLMRAAPSPVVELNRSVAVAMRDGPEAGLALIDAILARGDLTDYHLAHSARADLCRRLGRTGDARASYQRALAIARQEPERRFLERRLAECRIPASPDDHLTGTRFHKPKGDTTMRFMMFMIPRVYQPDTPPGEKAGEGFAPSAEAVARMVQFNEELAKAGALIALDGLHPSAKGARVTFAGGKPKVTDGPFTEAKEVVGGYWIIEAKSKEEAVGWARRCPAGDGDVIEVRQVFELSDFPADVRKAADSPTVREQIEKRKAS